jgi:hypothetical protein
MLQLITRGAHLANGKIQMVKSRNFIHGGCPLPCLITLVDENSGSYHPKSDGLGIYEGSIDLELTLVSR